VFAALHLQDVTLSLCFALAVLRLLLERECIGQVDRKEGFRQFDPKHATRVRTVHEHSGKILPRRDSRFTRLAEYIGG
jgi:hypothetical protein